MEEFINYYKNSTESIKVVLKQEYLFINAIMQIVYEFPHGQYASFQKVMACYNYRDLRPEFKRDLVELVLYRSRLKNIQPENEKIFFEQLKNTPEGKKYVEKTIKDFFDSCDNNDIDYTLVLINTTKFCEMDFATHQQKKKLVTFAMAAAFMESFSAHELEFTNNPDLGKNKFLNMPKTWEILTSLNGIKKLLGEDDRKKCLQEALELASAVYYQEPNPSDILDKDSRPQHSLN
jgi:hypothetical protein